MATLVLTAVGTYLGGSLGGALGSLVGQSIDQQLLGPGMRKGPRLGDLSVQTSSYGSAIPRIYGKMRVAGTVVWATDLKEEEAVQGGGKSGPEQLTYLYTANFAVALSSRPIVAVRRIWADGKLIRGADGDFKVRTKFRLHTGSEDQPVDPLIASVETISDTPAYRGLALAVFEDLELAEFGNRIPVLTFEIEADDAEVPLHQLLDDASGGVLVADDVQPIPGFAVHGSSIGDSLRELINLTGIDLAERDGRLKDRPASEPILLTARELGCDSDGEVRPKAERLRAPESALPAGLSMTYYDPDRDRPLDTTACRSAATPQVASSRHRAGRWSGECRSDGRGRTEQLPPIPMADGGSLRRSRARNCWTGRVGRCWFGGAGPGKAASSAPRNYGSMD